MFLGKSVFCRIILSALACLFLFLASCGQKSSNQNFVSLGLPGEYFPLSVGLTWTYKVTFGEVEPVGSEEVYWPSKDGAYAYSTRFRFSGYMEGKKSGAIIKLQAAALAAKQGMLNYPNGVKIEVLADSLGFFYSAKEVFFNSVYSEGERFMAQMVTIKDAYDSPVKGAWGELGVEDGTSMRLMLFGARPGIEMSPSGSRDKLLFDDPEMDFNGRGARLRFVRTVEPLDDSSNKDEEEVLKRSFTETIWFARDTGLVKLVQTQNGKMAMTWELVAFSKEPITKAPSAKIDEPPMDFGKSYGGQALRKTKLREMKKEGTVYDVDYPGCKLSSVVIADLYSGAMLTETFAGKWVIVYEYGDNSDRYLKFPKAFSIYKADGKTLINRYELVKMITQVGGLYKGKGGRERIVSFSYFEVAQGLSDNMMHGGMMGGGFGRGF